MSDFSNVLISKSLDPYFNLAFEEHILRDVKPSEAFLFVWRSLPSMVLGRFQLPWKECRLSLMKEEQVNLVRRQSGGGCVYHDQGNLNFTFFWPFRDFHSAKNNEFMKTLGRHFDINLLEGTKNDFLVSKDDYEYKVSGSAFKQTKDYSFHHLSLLVESDLTKLDKYTKKLDENFEDKGIDSRRAAVINLNQLNPNIKIECILAFLQSTLPVQFITEDDYDLSNYKSKLKSPEWLYEEGPKFSYHLSPAVEIFVEKAKVKCIKKNNEQYLVENLKLSQEELLDYFSKNDLRELSLDKLF